MKKTTLFLIIIAVIVAAIIALFFLYSKRSTSATYSPVVTIKVNGQTFTLNSSNQTASSSITVPYSGTVDVTVTIADGAPNSTYTVSLSSNLYSTTTNSYNLGGTYTIATNSSGNGSTSFSFTVYNSGAATISITGPGISGSYTLTLNVTMFSPGITIAVDNHLYMLSLYNPISSGTISVQYGSTVNVTVSVSNGVANSTYTVSFNGNNYTITTDSSGNGSTSFSFTANVSGTYTISISGPGILMPYTFTLKVEVSGAPISYNPIVTLTVNGQSFTLSNSQPNISYGFSVTPGTTISIAVAVSGGAPNSTYTVQCSSSYITPCINKTYTITTDSSGNGSTSFSFTVGSCVNSLNPVILLTISGPGIINNSYTGGFNFTLTIGPP